MKLLTKTVPSVGNHLVRLHYVIKFFFTISGLFLNTLFDKLENMLGNNVYVNLHLTGLFSRLAIYPHPLLRTYLLNHKIVLQPNIRSLFQVSFSMYVFMF